MERNYTKETFSSELQNAHKLFFGEALTKVLHDMRNLLEDPAIISTDNVHSMLIAFREVQDYSAMVQLVEDLNSNTAFKFASSPSVNQLYAFALIRRNQKGDRDLAEQIIKGILEEQKNHNASILCLYGRIYKDKFVESGYSDMESLENAIYWYRKGFDIHSNEFAGINLLTLLVAKGNDFNTCPELQKVALMLNNAFSEKENLENMTNYWDVATLFEMSVLLKDYSKAVAAAACMYKLKPSTWCLQSTIGNINIIDHSQSLQEQVDSPERNIFQFWMKFFMAASEKIEETCATFPVLFVEPSKVCVPGYAVVDEETKTCSIGRACQESSKTLGTDLHKFLYGADAIKSMRVNEHDECVLLLCVHQNSQEISVAFPSVQHRKRFYLLAQNILSLP